VQRTSLPSVTKISERFGDTLLQRRESHDPPKIIMMSSSCPNKNSSSSNSSNHTEQDSTLHSETKDTTEVASNKVNRASSSSRKQEDASEVVSSRQQQQHQSPSSRSNNSGRWFLPFGATTPSPVLPQFHANNPAGPPNHRPFYYHYHYNGLCHPLSYFPPSFHRYPQHPRRQRRPPPVRTSNMAPFDNFPTCSSSSIDTAIHDRIVQRPECTSTATTDAPIHHKVSYEEQDASGGARRSSPSWNDPYYYYHHYYHSSSYPSPVYTTSPFEPYSYDYDEQYSLATPPSAHTRENNNDQLQQQLQQQQQEEEGITNSTTSTPLTNNQSSSSSKKAAAKAAAAASAWQPQLNGEYYFMDPHSNAEQQQQQQQRSCPPPPPPGYYDYYCGGSPRSDPSRPNSFWRDPNCPQNYYKQRQQQQQRSPRGSSPFYFDSSREETYCYPDYRPRHSALSSSSYPSSDLPSSWGYLACSSESFDDDIDNNNNNHDDIPVPPPPTTHYYSPMTRSAPPKVTPSTGTSIRRKGGTEKEENNEHAFVEKVLKSSSPNTARPTDSNALPKKTSPIKSKKVGKSSGTSSSALGDLDIVVGRGAPTNYHIGNEAFRQLVSEFQTAYFCAKRSDKPLIAMQVLDVLKERGSRFVRRQKCGGGRNAVWQQVNQKLAYEKVCAALRDGAPQVQRQLLSSSSQKYRAASATSEDQHGGGSMEDASYSEDTNNTYAGYHPRANLFSTDGDN
jgi:hypothetical protein